MKLSIFLPDLRPGGAERMRLQMAKVWLQRGIAVDFVLMQARGELMDQLPAGARVIDLQAVRVRQALWPLRRYLREVRPGALLAAMWPLTVAAPLAAKLAGYHGRVVVSEHDTMTISYADSGGFHRCAMRRSMRVGYSLADDVVAVSEGVADDLVRITGIARKGFVVIYNPASSGVGMNGAVVSFQMPTGRPVILSVGTLKRQKRHDLLIRAFARMRHADARLFILGEGSERGRLESLVLELGLEDRVLLPGYQPDTAPWYVHSDLFVLSSDHEGFGNVIVEALEQGTPVVSTDCPSGPREILEDGKYGTLVPVGDVDALAKAMDEALSRDHDREALKRRAQDFSVDKAADAYLDLLLPGWRQDVSRMSRFSASVQGGI